MASQSVKHDPDGPDPHRQIGPGPGVVYLNSDTNSILVYCEHKNDTIKFTRKLLDINCGSKSVQLVSLSDLGNLRLNQEALAILAEIEKPVAVLSICGPSRSGKSYFLSMMLGLKDVFQTSDSFDACTSGVWMATTVLECEKFVIVFMDTEGTDHVTQVGDIINYLVLLTLLSSYLIYNSKGMQTSDLDKMSHFANLSERILIQKDVPKDDLHEDNLKKHLPHFLWLLRDSSLKLPRDGEHQLTATEYLKTRVLVIKDGNPEVVTSRVKRAIMTLFPSLECHKLPHPCDANLPEDDPRFVKEITGMFNFILQRITPKQGYKEGVHPNGSILAALAQQYVDNLNENKPPNLEWSWQSATEQYLTEFARKLEDEYESDMSKDISSRLPMEEGTIETLSDVEIIESFEPTLLSIHRSCFEQKLKQLKDQVDHLMPFVPIQDSTANAVQDKKKKIYNAYEARIVVIKEHSVVGGRLLTFIKENHHSSEVLCMKKFDEIQNSLRQQDKFSIQLLKLEYEKQAVGPAKKEVYEQKRKLVPDPPMDIKCVPKHDALALIWKEPHSNPGIIKVYKVELLQNSRPKRYFYSDSPKLSIEVTDLTPNTQYRVRICSLNEPYRSEYSQYIDIQTTAGVPAKPNKPEVCSESAGRVKISIYRLPKKHQNGSPVNKIIVQCESFAQWETSLETELPIKANDEVKPIVMFVSLPFTSNIKNIYYRVAMENSAGRSEFSEVATLPVIEIHPYRTDLIIQGENIFPRHVRLRLSPPKSYPNSVKYFSIRMKEGKSSQWKTIAQKCEQSEFTVEKLKPATTYTFQVACCSAKHEGEWSKECKVTTKADNPNPPKKPEINNFNTGKGKCTLTIPGISKGDDNGNSIKKIIIEHDENNCNSWSKQEIEGGMNEKPFRCSLSPIFKSSFRDAILYYRVRFVNDKGASDPSDVVQVHVTDLYPNQPEDIQPVIVTANQVKLEWKRPHINPASVTYFNIKHKKVGEKFIVEEKCNEAYYCANGLLPGTDYMFEIYSCNQKYTGEGIQFKQKTKPGPPEPPEKLQLHQVQQNGRIVYYLTFQKLSSENEHGSPVNQIIVESSNDANTSEWIPQTHPVEINDKVIQVPIAPYDENDDATCFFYRAYFINSAGKSSHSDILNVSVMDLFPQPPKNFHVSQSFPRSIRLEWDRPTYNPQSVTHYSIMMAENNCYGNNRCIAVKEQFHIYDNLMPARSYKFRAASCNSKFPAGGEWCEEIIEETIADKPSRPSKPETKIESDENGKIKYWLCVPMLSEDNENGSPVDTVIVESKRHNAVTYDSVEYSVCRNNAIESLLIEPPNAIEIFTLHYRVRMKNQAGTGEPSDIHELESAQMIPGPPKNLIADRDGVFFNSIVLSWEEPDENPKSVEYYLIQKRLQPQSNERDISFNDEWSVVKKCEDVEFTKASATQLNPNTKYQFQIISFNKDGRRCRQSSDVLKISTSPCRPKKPDSCLIILTVTNQNSATISLPKQSYDETGSEIQEMSVERLDKHMQAEESTPNLNNPFIYQVPKGREERIKTDIPIGNATHYIRVKLKNSEGYGSYSDFVGVAPEDLKPGAPIIIKKENLNPTTNSVVIEWNAPTLHKRAANSYMFQIKKECDLEWSQPIKPDNHVRNGDSHRATLRNLSPCTQYRVCIYAANGAIRGDLSEGIIILTKAGKPHTPPVPTIYIKDPTKASVSFEHKIEHDNGASIEMIRVERYTDEKVWKLVHEEIVQDPKSDFFDVNVPLESVNLPLNLNSKCEYHYRVKLKNRVGESSPSKAVPLPFSVLKPGKVQDVKYEAKAHHITLYWKMPEIHPAIVNSYTIEEQICVNECAWKPIQICEAGTNSSTIKFLASNKDYVYRITAVSKYDVKGIPLIVQAKTEEIFPTRPLDVRVDRRCSNMFKVRWKEPHCDPDALHYYKLEVFEGTSADSKLVYVCTLKKKCKSKVVSNLNSSTKYLIKVTAMNEAKHWRKGEEQKSYDEIIEETPMSKIKRKVASTFMGIPTFGLAAAAFLCITKPDAEGTMIDSDDESSYLDEWSLKGSTATCQLVKFNSKAIADIEMDRDGDANKVNNDEDDVGPNEEAQNLLQ